MPPLNRKKLTLRTSLKPKPEFEMKKVFIE